MSVWLFNWWNKLRSSLWLIPSCMAFAGVLLSMVVPYLDITLSPQEIDSLRWLSNMGPEGAMTLLSTIAGSMITIAGVVFSITIVALTLASAQFGPRLLGNFMRDRGNQIVLGTFVTTFLYCLLVLRTIHVDSGSGGSTPYWGVFLGLLMAVGSLGVLIYFVHHIAVSIQAPNLIAAVDAELVEALDRLFPESMGKEKKNTPNPSDIEDVLAKLEKEGVDVKSETGGYLQAIENDKLLEIAHKENLILLLYYRPGHFLIKGTSLGRVLMAGPVKDSLFKSINQQFICGTLRTQDQDIEFAVLQLVEVAVRALSPGVNDPFTCIQCIDHLSAVLCQLVQREFPSPYRYDKEEALRILALPVTFEGILNAAFHLIRQHGQGNVEIVIRLLDGMGRIGECVEREKDREAVHHHIMLIERGSRESLQTDFEVVDKHFRQALALLSHREKRSSLLHGKIRKYSL